MSNRDNLVKRSSKASGSSASVTSNATATAAPNLNVNSSERSVARYDIASERIPTIKLYLSGQLTAVEAAKVIGMKASGFHKIIRRVRARGGDLSAVTASAPGRRNSPSELLAELEQLIIDAIRAYAGKAATIEKVWVTAQILADERGLKRPSYHAVRRRLLKKGKRFLANLRLGKVEAADIFEARPGYKVTTRPLEWVQIDHTRVDLIVVDEEDRKVIDRPWVSFAICIHTRAIVGFYLTLLPPNAVTVAMLIENCVLPKTAMLASLGLDASVWPMHGVPEVIHADNAAEFRSEVLKANLKRFGVRVEHRDVGKKHQGGHIERLTGDYKAAMRVCAEWMNDFKRIRIGDGYSKLRPVDLIGRNIEAREFLATELSRYFEGKTVVVTHHCPIQEVAGDGHEGHLGAAYFNQWHDLVAQADVWIFGHTHHAVDTNVSGCRVVSNPLGYPGEKTGFLPGFTIEI